MKTLKLVQTILLSIIGAVSVFMTTSIVFDLFGIRDIEGNYVPFVVYANMICGVLYLYAARMNYKDINKSMKALILALIILIITFISVGIYIKNGGIFETQMPKAMTFRTIFTAVMVWASFYLKKR